MTAAHAASWAAIHKGKLRRQLAIIEAARDLIMESGSAGLNMRDVASRAGVSMATPYNLFGSKAEILQAIYEEEQIKFLTSFEKVASTDALSRVFQSLDYTFDFYSRHPDFYGAIVRMPQADTAGEAATAMRTRQVEFFGDLLRGAISEKDLRQDAPVEVVSSVYTRAFNAICLEWLDGALTPQQARSEAAAGLALLLSGGLTRRGREKLSRIQALDGARSSDEPPSAG
jgi:AcrR family transcriptional regulator